VTILTHEGEELEQPKAPLLYHHTKRPEWGLAIVAWERPEKRAYQFQDGQLRVFKDGFYQFLEEVDLPADQSAEVLASLGRALGRSEKSRASGTRKATALIPLSAQIAYFREQFPEGFGDEAWLSGKRGSGAPRRLKRHRDPAVAQAREALDKGVLDDLIAKDEHIKIIEALLAVLTKTDLVSTVKLAPLSNLAEDRQAPVAEALRDLLYGDGAIVPRLTRFNSWLAKGSWELVTAPLGLVHPDVHICVRQNVFKQQAQWMAPRMVHSTKPDGPGYERYLSMVGSIAEKLTAEGMPPRDLFDVFDFCYETLRPAVRASLAKENKPTVAVAEAATTEAATTEAATTEAATTEPATEGTKDGEEKE